MIWCTGDIHSDPRRFSTENFPEQKGMTKEDFVVILGDFGLVWDTPSESKTEKYWLDWLERKPFTTLFLDGNHENYDRLDAYPVTDWQGGKVQRIRPSVLHLMRGQVFDLQGKSFFVFGGASSHDVSDGILELDDPNFKEKLARLERNPYALYRINHLSWWQRELPSEEEMREGLENLRQRGNKVDFILTHSPDTALLKQLDEGRGLYPTDYLEDYLQKIRQTAEHRLFLFAHMHINQNFPGEKAICLYEQFVRVV